MEYIVAVEMASSNHLLLIFDFGEIEHLEDYVITKKGDSLMQGRSLKTWHLAIYKQLSIKQAKLWYKLKKKIKGMLRLTRDGALHP